MHTMKRWGKSEWVVGRIEQDNTIGGDVFEPMFAGLSISSTLYLTNVLNGGDAEIGVSVTVLDSCWKIAENKEKM